MLQDLTKTQTNWEKALISTLNIKTLSYEELNDLFQYATRKIEKNKQQFDQYKATNERLLGTKNAADSVLSDANANETVKAAFQQLKQSFSDIDKQIEDNKNKMEELVNQLKSQMSAAEAIKKQIDAHSSEGTGD